MKLFVLGLDGATFDCLNPLMEEGIIPNIADMCARWASGPLQTIFPPVTAPAWLALATGLNPGKTGVFDYINKVSTNNENMAPVSSAHYNKRAIWDLLNEAGYKTGIFNYPTLSPPPRVKGFSVSGMGGHAGHNFCYPPELENDLQALTGGYESKLNLRSPKYRKNISLFFEDIHRIMLKQVNTLKFLINKKEWDFLFAVFSFTDWMQHVLWKDIDERHSLYNPKTSPAIKQRYKDTWRIIDNNIGDLLSILPDHTNLMIVSDHGAGPVESVFYPNPWLEDMGWLVRKKAGWRGMIADNIKFFSEGSDNKYFNKLLYLLRTKILKISSSTELIDLDNSLAYSPEHNTMFGCISLTQKGKARDGFKDDVIKKLKALPDIMKGISGIQIYLPEEIYSGPYVRLSPDILFIINNHRSTVEIDFSNKAFVQSPSIEMRSGGHLPNGVYITRGDVFKHHTLNGISVLDIAPTILALYDIAIPPQIDGRVLTECLHPRLLDTINIRKSAVETMQSSQQESENEADLEEMKKLLKSLGYL